MSAARSSGAGRRTEAAKLAAEAEALRQLRAHATVSIATTAAVLGVGRDRAMLAVERGDIVSIKVAGERRVCSAPLLAALGLGPEPIPAFAATQTEVAP